MSATWKPVGVLALAFSAVTVLPTIAAAAGVANPTFTKDIAPIFQNKCEACHRPDSIAPMSLVTYEESRPWARSIKSRVDARQMPPWHIDKTVGIQRVQERSLAVGRPRSTTIVKWVDAGAPKGDPKDMPRAGQWPSEQGWNFAKKFGQTEPDMVIKSIAVDAEGRRRTTRGGSPSSRPGSPKPRWVRAIEIRPSTVKGRKITHHAIARLQQDETDPLAQNRRTTRTATPQPGTFMEWAVGKQGEMMRPNCGKLMLPGSKIVWDIHYSNGGEDITDDVELGIYFYPKGQEPKFRQVLHLMGAHQRRAGRSARARFPPNIVKATEGYLRAEGERPHRELPAAHAPARQGDARWKRSCRVVRSRCSATSATSTSTGMTSYVYADDAAPLLPKGTIIKVDGVARQHRGEQEQSRSERVGRLRRSHGRRDGARVGQRHLHERRRLQGRTRGAPRATRREAHDAAATTAVAAGAAAPLGVPDSRRKKRRRRPSGAAPFPVRRGSSMKSIPSRGRHARGCDRRRQLGHRRYGSAGPSRLAQPLTARAAPLGGLRRPAGCLSGDRRLGAAARTAPTPILIGYYNRNKEQTIDIPIGPNNHDRTGRPRHAAADALRAGSRVRRVRDAGAEGLRQQEAHVDAGGQRPAHDDRPVARSTRRTGSISTRTPRRATRRR